jgi:hypothetical protein
LKITQKTIGRVINTFLAEDRAKKGSNKKVIGKSFFIKLKRMNKARNKDMKFNV